MTVKQGTLSSKNGIMCRLSKQTECVPASALKPTPRNPTTPTKKIDSLYDLYDHKTFRFWVRKISEVRLPTSAELADLLEANSDGAIPSWLIPIIVQGLRGELKQPAGRPPATVRQNMLLQIAIAQYPRYLAWLKAREKCSGLTGWSLIRESDWWVGPPHERAARIVTARWLQHMDWRSFLNRVPSQKPGRSFCE